MTLQGQLAQEQERWVFPFNEFSRFEPGLLGNKAAQSLGLVEPKPALQSVEEHRVDTTSVEPRQSPEMAWLEENASQLGQLKGEWLLIRGRQLVVHSHDFATVRAAVRQQQIHSPFVYYVPTDDESNSVTI